MYSDPSHIIVSLIKITLPSLLLRHSYCSYGFAYFFKLFVLINSRLFSGILSFYNNRMYAFQGYCHFTITECTHYFHMACLNEHLKHLDKTEEGFTEVGISFLYFRELGIYSCYCAVIGLFRAIEC